MTSKVEDLPDFAIVWTFFEKFGKHVGFENVTINDVSNWLEQQSTFEKQEVLESTDESSEHKNLADVLIKLMRKTGMRVGKQRWQNHLMKVAERNDYSLALEMQECGFYNLSKCKKLQIIKWICEMQFDDNVKMKTLVNTEEVTNLRMQPLGRDVDGFVYWYFEDSGLNMRLMVEDEADEDGWKVVCRNCKDLASLISYLGKDSQNSEDKQIDEEDLEDKFEKFLQFECTTEEEGRILDGFVLKEEEEHEITKQTESTTETTKCNGIVHGQTDNSNIKNCDNGGKNCNEKSIINSNSSTDAVLLNSSIEGVNNSNALLKTENILANNEIKSSIKNENSIVKSVLLNSNTVSSDIVPVSVLPKQDSTKSVDQTNFNETKTDTKHLQKTSNVEIKKDEEETLSTVKTTGQSVTNHNTSSVETEKSDNTIKIETKFDSVELPNVEDRTQTLNNKIELSTNITSFSAIKSNKLLENSKELSDDVDCIVRNIINEIICNVTSKESTSNAPSTQEEEKTEVENVTLDEIRTKDNEKEENIILNEPETSTHMETKTNKEISEETKPGKNIQSDKKETEQITIENSQETLKTKKKSKRKNALLERLQAEADMLMAGNKSRSSSDNSSSYRTRSGRVVKKKQDKSTNDVWEQLPEEASEKVTKSSPKVDEDFVYVESKSKPRTNVPKPEPEKPTRVRKFLASCCEKCKLDTHPDTILLCDECDLGYHMACLSPPLMLIPDDDWFCPVCSQNQLVKKLQEIVHTLQTKIISEEKRKKQLERKKILNQYVGIHTSNIIPATVSANKKPAITRRKSGNQSSSSGSDDESNSSSTMGEEDNIITTRRCRNKVNYDFKTFDKTIMEAIGGDVKAELSDSEDRERPVSGKDIRTIIAAEKESKNESKTSAGKRKKRKLTLGNSSGSEYEDSDPNFSMSSKETDEEEFTFPPEEDSNTDDEIFIGVRNKLRKRKLPQRNKKKKKVLKKKKRKRYSDSESASVSMSSSSEEDVKEKNPWINRAKRRRKKANSNSEDTDEYVPPKITKTKQKETKKRVRVKISDESSESAAEKFEENNKETEEKVTKKEEETPVKPHDKSANLADDEDSNESTKWSPASSNADVSDEHSSSSSNYPSDSEIQAPLHIS